MKLPLVRLNKWLILAVTFIFIILSVAIVRPANFIVFADGFMLAMALASLDRIRWRS